MCDDVLLTPDEKKFIEFMDSFSSYLKPAYIISKSSSGRFLLNNKKGKNTFKLYDLDNICKSCTIFIQGDNNFTPKTTDALYYKKDKKGQFYIYLIEFKGDKLYNKSKKCELVEYLNTLEERINDPEDNNDEDAVVGVRIIERIVDKYSDKMLNGLAMKPLETVTISLPLIYQNYCNKNPNVEPFDIVNFLRNSKVVYRLVSLPNEKDDSNDFKDHLKSLTIGDIRDVCLEKGLKEEDMELLESYESNLETYYTRYAEANIISDNKNFISTRMFNNFIESDLKKSNILYKKC